MNSTKLKGCAGRQCQALCCYDGVYLSSKDANRIHDALIKHPEFFIGMTKDYIVHSEWEGIVSGFKTATMPHEFKGSAPPKHFNKTRCVFVGDDNLCLLEVAARAVGSHKWAFKPTSCCLFPFALDSDGKTPFLLTADLTPAIQEKRIRGLHHTYLAQWIHLLTNRGSRSYVPILTTSTTSNKRFAGVYLKFPTFRKRLESSGRGLSS